LDEERHPVSDMTIPQKPFLNSKRRSYALIAGAILWAGWLASILLGKGNRDAAGQVLGVDFLAFYTGGKLVNSGQSAELYDLRAQQVVQRQVAGEEWGDLDIYFNPPFYAWLFMPFALLPYKLSVSVWIVSELAALWLSLMILGVKKPARAFFWALTFSPVFSAVSFGQNTLMSLALLSLTYALWRDGKLWAAGLVCSLLLYKPQLILGIGVLWFLEWLLVRRGWQSLAGLALGGIALAGLSFLFMPDASRAYIEFSRKILPGFTTWEGYPLWNAHTPRAFWQLLLPGLAWLSDGLYVLCLVAGLAVYGVLWRKFRSQPAWLYAGAICLTLWLTPHAMIYDWAILLIPAVLLWQNSSADWKGIYALVWVAAFISGPFTLGQLKLLPLAVQISVPVLAVSVVWISRLLYMQNNPTPKYESHEEYTR
jgi:alpha-1,2-mannosyltransferase